MWFNCLLAGGAAYFAVCLFILMFGGLTSNDDVFWFGAGGLLVGFTLGLIAMAVWLVAALLMAPPLAG
jgi:hypothetical protein